MNTKPLHLLLADDDEDDCLFFNEALEELSMGTALQIVHDGVELMKYLNALEQLPDVLFLDLNMPLKDGIACLCEIKQNDKLKTLPVVIISTSLDRAVVDALHEQGAHYYIRKPGNFTKLKDQIHTALIRITENNSQPARENFLITVN